MEVNKYMAIILIVFLAGCAGLRAHTAEPPAKAVKAERPDCHYSPNAVQHTFYEVGETVEPSLSWDGSILYFASSQNSANFQLYCKKVGEIPTRQMTFGAADQRQPAISPNGQLLAYVSNRRGKWDVLLLPLIPGAKEIQLTAGQTDSLHPSWSPDGRRIVYSAYNQKAARWELMMITLSGDGWKITSLNTEGLFPSWQPVEGSELIVFQKPRGREPDLYGLWVVTSDGKQLVEIVDSLTFGAVTPTWTRDGKWIVFSSVPAESATEGRAGNLWVVRVDGKSLTKISEGTSPEYWPACAPDGSIFFTSLRNGVKNIWSLTPGYGGEEEKAPLEPGNNITMAVK